MRWWRQVRPAARRCWHYCAEYGIAAARAEPAGELAAALAAASSIGYPVVLKTDEPAIAHKSDAGGVLLGIGGPAELTAGYADLAARLGPRVLVCQAIPPGPELSLGLVRDPGLGPLLVIGAGGMLVELLADRVVALPPVDARLAGELLDGLRVSKLLAGVRGAPAAHRAPFWPPSPACPSWPPSWATTWTPWTSTRSSAARTAPSPWTR